MVEIHCPSDAELLAWLKDPLDLERHELLTSHINTCRSCQNTLEKLDRSEEQEHAASDDDNLLHDLRRQPPVDELETEPECATASSRVQSAASFPASSGVAARQPDSTDVQSLEQRGHYEILGVLGQGGMGVVYKARNLKMNRLAAIKVLPPLKPQDAAAVARFEREMKAVARLSHPNIVTAYDADEVDGKHFLVMEYIDGWDLRSLMKSEGPLPVAKAVDYIAQAARGLNYAHQQGIVHRDIKPANLMLDRNGTVKVLDLGLALSDSRGGPQADLTETGILMGTVDYLSPEQAASTRDIDGRADIYSLGCSLFYLLTGRALYDGDTAIQKVLAHREKPIPSLRDACPDAPASLERVFAKMVAKRPEERCQTMVEVIADLEMSLAALADPTTAVPSAPPSGASLSNHGPSPRSSTGSRVASWAAVGVALLVILGLLAAGLGGFRRSPIAGNPDQVAFLPLAQGSRAGQEWDGDELGMKFCWCPPGTFLMGSPKTEAGRAEFESPPAEVVLSRGFWMGKFEVTQDEWERVMGTKPSRFQGAPTLPVENVTWKDATAFCSRMSKNERTRGSIPPGWEFRLPTEAQWEYACRAGTTTAYSFGPTTDGIADYMWYGYSAEYRTHEVGRKRPNAWGLHDMHGNVWEWCRDWFSNRLPGGMDPEVNEVGTGRVMRGGGWNAAAHLCRTAFRSGQVPDEATHLLGFRVAIVQVGTIEGL